MRTDRKKKRTAQQIAILLQPKANKAMNQRSDANPLYPKFERAVNGETGGKTDE